LASLKIVVVYSVWCYTTFVFFLFIHFNIFSIYTALKNGNHRIKTRRKPNDTVDDILIDRWF